MTFRIKVPQDLAADPMRVMYRSQKCPVQRSDGSGERFEVDGYYAIEVVPQHLDARTQDAIRLGGVSNHE